ncbi:MnhB domain-containing protein [Luteimonas abyssi]|uniref:MnhB domain-containing protein n=1 Tax=Luteimonas abyssi TaxID=1247514 RepID=UPI000737C695|nr:MnhB domain-containing protein [Luteimonas abyssi]
MTPRALILTVAARAIYPLMLLVSAWILLRGHNEPGGGFIGGMVAVSATAMLAVAHGADVAMGRMPGGAMRLATAGVLLSLISGLPALFLGLPYMTHLWGTLPLGFTDVDVSTVLLFDIGVFAAVWGALGGVCASAIAIDEAVR